MNASKAWARIIEWTAAHAPRTRASFLPPIPEGTLRAELEPLGRPVPDSIITLYGLAGGQSPSTERAAGIFEGYWFMPLAGVDGLKQAWADWQTAHEAGAEWATLNRFPFAKDFSGQYLCVEIPEGAPDEDEDEDDDEVDAPIVEVGGAEPEERAENLGWFLELLATKLEEAGEPLDAPIMERHVVQFDACRPRQVGDAARHSVLDALGIRATIEGLDQLFAPPNERPETLFGLAARLIGDELSYEHVDVELTDDRERPLPAAIGKRTGGGVPGVLVYVWSKRPLPAGARLRVTITRRKTGGDGGA